MGFINKLFRAIGSWFSSPKAQAIEKELAALVQAAAPIVANIAALTPNRTDDEIAAAYAKYGVPFAASVEKDPTATGNALLNLATAVLQKNHAPAAATYLLNTAVQLALVPLKS